MKEKTEEKKTKTFFLKNKKVILINLIFVMLVFILIEAVAYFIACKKHNELIPHPIRMETYKEFYDRWEHGDLRCHAARKPEGLNYKKAPILWFGCSVGYGAGLEANQIGSYKLARLTHRPVLNRAMAGGYAGNMLYQLRDTENYKNSKIFHFRNKKPEYIIYIWDMAQTTRMYRYTFWSPSPYIYLRYKNTNGHLAEINTNHLYSKFWALSSVQLFLEHLEMSHEHSDEVFDFLKLFFIESQKEAIKQWPDVKFVIFKYRTYDNGPCQYHYTDTPRWKELEKEGFTIIDMTDLVGQNLCNKNYRISDEDWHPNEKAWDAIIPRLAQKLNL